MKPVVRRILIGSAVLVPFAGGIGFFISLVRLWGEEERYYHLEGGRWIRQLADEDPGERLRAIERLQEMGPPAHKAIPSLIQALNDPDEHIRDAARQAIEKIDPKAEKAKSRHGD